MYSRDHAIISLVVGLLGVWTLSLPEAIPWWAAVCWAVALGVGIDFDHFVVARLVGGDWAGLGRVLRNPLLPLTDPGAIFADDDLWAIQRLLSHVVIAGVLVLALWQWDRPFALFSAAVLYAHLLSDLVWDNYRLEEYQRRHAAAVRKRAQAADGADVGVDPKADADPTTGASADERAGADAAGDGRDLTRP